MLKGDGAPYEGATVSGVGIRSMRFKIDRLKQVGIIGPNDAQLGG